MGNHNTLYKVLYRPETPVFDRARSVDLNPASRVGLSPHAGENSKIFGFRRDARDRKSGTPLPPEATGDPAPDRRERAEALRRSILATEARHKIIGSEDREPLHTGEPNRKGRAPTTPDIDQPGRTYRRIDPEHRVLEARRAGRVLYFATVTDAVLCLGGELKAGWVKAVQNASGGVTKTAFGWEWTRIAGRRSRRRVRL